MRLTVCLGYLADRRLFPENGAGCDDKTLPSLQFEALDVLGRQVVTLLEVEERVRELIDAHSEDERGDIIDPPGLIDKLYRFEQELIRARLLGAA